MEGRGGNVGALSLALPPTTRWEGQARCHIAHDVALHGGARVKMKSIAAQLFSLVVSLGNMHSIFTLVVELHSPTSGAFRLRTCATRVHGLYEDDPSLRPESVPA